MTAAFAALVSVGPGGVAATTVTFVADADSYVRSTQATTNFGTSTLQSCAPGCGSPQGESLSFVHFTVSGLSGSPTAVQLSLFSDSTGVTKTQVYSTASTWTETGINYGTKPAQGNLVGTTGTLTAGQRTTADVTSAVTGNGTYSFELKTTATAVRIADSREGANPPQLLVTSGSPTSSPPPSSSAASSSAASSSAASSSAASSSSGQADPVIALAGDIACAPSDPNYNTGNGVSGHCRMKTTVGIGKGFSPSAVLALGDEQYNSGKLADFISYDKSWGLVKSITKPTVGNHEYGTSGAAGYFTYFGAVANGGASCSSNCGGYYSFDLGTWHIVSINTECTRINGGVGCAAGSPQEAWLKADLAAHTNVCTLVFGHRPRWSSNSFANSDIAPLITDMYRAHVDVYAAGHSHSYERLAPQSDTGAASANGITEIVVGTGGSFFTGFGTVVANSVIRKSNIFGVLKMVLKSGSYSWSYQVDSSTPWSAADSGSASCH